MISVAGLGHNESGRKLFNNLSFGIEENSRIALVGRNGCGKTSLLKIISGLKKPEEGDVVHNRELRYAFLEQSPGFEPEERIADFILSGDSEEIRLIREYETMINGMEGGDVNESRISGLMTEMEKLDCWSLEQRIHSILSELGINDLTSRMSELSGGMIKKTALARTLVTESNLLILDEPTNHLDIETINWLEKFIRNSGKALLLVTHDRYFMDSVCNTIFEIDNQKLYTYEGNYSRYLELKAQREEAEERAADRINNFLRNELDWIQRGPRARAGKDKKRKNKFFDVLNSRPEKKAETDGFSVEGKRLGGKILDIESAGKSFGDIRPVSDFSFSFRKGDKIGILGSNGSGKTTLLNLMAGKLLPDEGEIETGVNTRIGYYDQMSKELPGTVKAVDYIKETAEVISLRDGTKVTPGQFLERFLFPKSLLYTEISRLSGGEKKKLYLLKILLSNPNFLIFDEPTNDFDIQTLSVLEDFLAGFAGCVVIVSHDRFFLDRTTDFLLVLDGSGGITGYSGDVMSYYEERQSTRSAEGGKPVNKERPSSGVKAVKREKKGLSFKEKQEFEGIEDEIMALEDEKAGLDTAFSSSETAAGDFGKMKNRYDELAHLIEEKYSRWEFLEAKRQGTWQS